MAWIIEENETTQEKQLTDGESAFLLTASDLNKLKTGTKASVKFLVNQKRNHQGMEPSDDDLAKLREQSGGQPFQSNQRISRPPNTNGER